METTITATELARNLSDILNRVRYRGERFRVERNGELVATIEPPVGRVFTVADFRRELGHLKIPVGLGRDIVEGRRALGRLPEDPWRSS
jgi:antitoxin (DNA-binding transcriptional repressor) of toxin-antitoxin stability system